MKIKKSLLLQFGTLRLNFEKRTLSFLKLEYAIKRSTDAVKAQSKKVQQEIDDIQLDNALIVAGEVKFNKEGAGGYAYSKAGETKRRKEIDKLLDEEIEVELHTVKYSDDMKEITGINFFFGNIITDAPALEETEEAYLAKHFVEPEKPKASNQN